MRNKLKIACLVSLGLISMGADHQAQAQWNVLDSTFGTGGKVVTSTTPVQVDGAQAVVVQKDGKIVTAGYSADGFSVIRYLPNGSLDTSFNGGGKVYTKIGINSQAFGIALQGDGKLLVAGKATIATSSAAALVRYTTNGALDTTFGNGGIVLTQSGDSSAAFDVKLDFANRPVICGESIVPGGASATVSRMLVARYTTSGALDTTFGNGGVALRQFSSVDQASARALYIYPRGQIALAGRNFNHLKGYFCTTLAFFQQSGAVDSSFNGGATILDFGKNSGATSLVRQADGKLLVGGIVASAVGSPPTIGLARLSPFGVPDSGFGNGGIKTLNLALPAECHALGLEAEAGGAQNIVVGGRIVDATFGNFLLARLHPDGTLATAPNQASTDFGQIESVQGLVVQADGKIIAAGTQFGGSPVGVKQLLTRYGGAPQVALSVANAATIEGSTPGTFPNVAFQVKLAKAAPSDVTFRFQTTGKTAISGTDFTSVDRVITIPAGNTSVTVNVPVMPDKLDEPDEQFSVLLSEATAPIHINSAVGTITDDDAGPLVRTLVQSHVEGNTSSVTYFTTVSLSTPSSFPVTVKVKSLPAATDAATANTDYIPFADQTLTFAPGETSKKLYYTVKHDLTPEKDEKFQVVLSEPTNATLGASGTITIENDDLPRIAVSDLVVPEGNSASTSPFVTVSLNGPVSDPVSFTYATLVPAGTTYGATPGSDFFTLVPTTVTIPAGETSKKVYVTVYGDTLVEQNEFFHVKLSNAVGGTIADDTAVVTITDDDVPTLSLTNLSVPEGASGNTFPIMLATLSGPTNKTVTFKAATTVGPTPNATAGKDYVALAPTSFTIPAGQTSARIFLTVTGDTQDEPDEKFGVILSDVVNATSSGVEGVCTILDDDEAPTLSVSDVTLAEGNAGSTSFAIFDVTLSRSYPANVTVQVQSAAAATNPATAGTDYDAVAPTTVTFAPGQTSRKVYVTVRGDGLVEADEKYLLKLSNAQGAVITKSEGVGTITNDDVLPTLSITDVSQAEGNGTSPTFAIFTVTLSRSYSEAVTVQYSTAGGVSPSATAGTDYTAMPLTNLTFSPTETTKKIYVTIKADNVLEGNENYTLVLSNPVKATLAKATGLGTILNDDSAAAAATHSFEVF